MSKLTSFAALLERFFTQRLMQQRQASPRQAAPLPRVRQRHPEPPT